MAHNNLIATVNGKPIYSDKQVPSIVNSVIHFRGGSWYNVNTNEVFSSGGGYITIGDNPDLISSEKITREPKDYSATTLEPSNLSADIDVLVGGDRIVVAVGGPADVLGKISTRQDSTVIIKSERVGSYRRLVRC